MSIKRRGVELEDLPNFIAIIEIISPDIRKYVSHKFGQLRSYFDKLNNDIESSLC